MIGHATQSEFQYRSVLLAFPRERERGNSAPGGRLEEDKLALQEARYKRFSGVLRAANAALAAIYRQLSGGQGDAYLAYADDRLLLFADGVTLHVRRAALATPVL